MLGWGVLSAAAGATAVLLLQWWSRTACRPGRRGRKGYTSIDAARNPEVVGGVIADAYEGTMLATVRHDYCVAMSTSLSETLQELVQETQQLKMPQMLSSPLTVRLLQSLIRAGSATRALEIGTYTGFTAVGMAEAMPQDGLVLCLDDFSDEAPFDLCFIDADKESQIAYVDLLSEGLISAGGCVVVDNTLWYSRVLRPRGRHDACTKAVVDFNQHVLKGPWHVALLPIRDGLTILQPVR
ncbi:O-methyltransferase MdmC [Durusdinium trenchii]|uniref:O-methyltransferase MdmC n=1 Tax=Durusdinium trenchii TaxID=1381693 RepID=A0ABP0K435_9DINO